MSMLKKKKKKKCGYFHFVATNIFLCQYSVQLCKMESNRVIIKIIYNSMTPCVFCTLFLLIISELWKPHNQLFLRRQWRFSWIFFQQQNLTSIYQDKTKLQENTKWNILKFKGRLEYTTNSEVYVQMFA